MSGVHERLLKYFLNYLKMNQDCRHMRSENNN